MQKQIIKISRGPQFRNGNAAIPFFIILFLIMGFVLAIIDSQWITGVILSFIITVLSLYVLDIQGVEIDTKGNRIKEYKLQVWGRIGKWQNHQAFEQLSLNFDSYFIRNYTFYTKLTTPGGKGISYDKDGRYLVVLDLPNTEKNIVLKESDNYNNALKEIRIIAKKLTLPYHDSIKNKTYKPRVRK